MKFIKVFLIAIVLLSAAAIIQAQEIIDAAKRGDFTKVKELVDKDAGLVSLKDNNGTTPLHFASSRKNLEMQKYLIEKGADVNSKEVDFSTPLHYAAVRNHSEGAVLLIEKGANIDALDNEKHTPLHLAAQSGLKDIVSILVKHGAKLEIRDDYGRTPLVLASRERGGPDVIGLLLDAGADINSIDNSGDNALSLAAWRGYINIIDILLDRNVQLPKFNRQLQALISSSAQKGIVRLFRAITATGFNVKNISTLLNDAASGGSKDIVSDLIDKGFEVNGKNIYGWAPIHYAAFNGRIETLKILIQKGADINIRNIIGQSAYNLAEQNGYAAVKQILIDNKADQSPTKFPELRGDYLGQTPPGKTPQIFAKGIVSSIWGLHSTPVFSPDGNEIYWRPMIAKPDAPYSTGGPLMMKKVNGVWTPPEQPAPFNRDINDDCPFFSPDGEHLFLISSRPLPGSRQFGKENIWIMDKSSTGWSEMRPYDATINAQEMHWQFSIDKAGNLYFGSAAGGGFGMNDIYCAKFENGKYSKPVNLGPNINSDKIDMCPFIAPDGSYLIFFRDRDLFISYLKKDGSWSKAINMGNEINSPGDELCPVVTPDGKYLFFNSSRTGDLNAYWVDAKIIEELKPENLN